MKNKLIIEFDRKDMGILLPAINGFYKRCNKILNDKPLINKENSKKIEDIKKECIKILENINKEFDKI